MLGYRATLAHLAANYTPAEIKRDEDWREVQFQLSETEGKYDELCDEYKDLNIDFDDCMTDMWFALEDLADVYMRVFNYDIFKANRLHVPPATAQQQDSVYSYFTDKQLHSDARFQSLMLRVGEHIRALVPRNEDLDDAWDELQEHRQKCKMLYDKKKALRLQTKSAWKAYCIAQKAYASFWF